MSNDIRVSVVVPVYNREKYLRQYVDSIVAQTPKEIEIILVYNGSTDGVQKFLSSDCPNSKLSLSIPLDCGGCFTMFTLPFLKQHPAVTKVKILN